MNKPPPPPFVGGVLVKISKAELLQRRHSKLFMWSFTMSSIPAGSQGKLPHRSPKNTFSIPNPCPRGEAKGKGYSQVLQGDLWVQLLHHLPGQQQRHGEKQRETEKTSFNSVTSQGFGPI